jgi:SH3-like domain-containing protein
VCRRAWLAALLWLGGSALAADFQATTEVTVLYDAPSLKGQRLFIVGRDTPLEVIVSVEGWLKIRDFGGSVAWVEKKAVADKRMLVVRVPVADVLVNPTDSAPLAFKAEQNVLLELVDAAHATTTPGWAKVRHRDGQIGYIRIGQVWGL